MSKGPTGIIAKLVELLRSHPEGLTSGEMRAKLDLKAEEQAQFDRRRREIRRWYRLEKKQVGNRAVYTLGEMLEESAKSGKISLKLRAEVLHHARGRCQMCGKTVADDEITLVVDHKIPRTGVERTTRKTFGQSARTATTARRIIFPPKTKVGCGR